MHAEMSNDMRKKKEKDMRGCFFRDREKQTVCGERKASKDKAQEKHKRGCLGMLLDVEHGERHVWALMCVGVDEDDEHNWYDVLEWIICYL